jgi:hypothetical protein
MRSLLDRGYITITISAEVEGVRSLRLFIKKNYKAGFFGFLILRLDLSEAVNRAVLPLPYLFRPDCFLVREIVFPVLI